MMSPDTRIEQLAQRIDALLPQTQCQQCGFAGCAPYARAIATGEALINRCPPGGQAGVERLAALLNQPALPLDPLCGSPKPPLVARIKAEDCIGCTLCIRACPTDAILGARKHLHAVLSDECTGCELCLPPCPVDCIVMVAVDVDESQWRARADQWRQRHHRRQHRLKAQAQTKAAQQQKQRPPASVATTDQSDRNRAIRASLEQARARLQSRKRAVIPGKDSDE